MSDDRCEGCGKDVAVRECAHGILCKRCDKDVHGRASGPCELDGRWSAHLQRVRRSVVRATTNRAMLKKIVIAKFKARRAADGALEVDRLEAVGALRTAVFFARRTEGKDTQELCVMRYVRIMPGVTPTAVIRTLLTALRDEGFDGARFEFWCDGTTASGPTPLVFYPAQKG